MNCYICRPSRSHHSSLLFIMLAWGISLVFTACHPSQAEADQGNGLSGREVADIQKPQIDTSKVLNTLELYRAKRFEGIQEAMNAGAEQVFKLVLYGRNMQSLPPDVGDFPYLASLDISHNALNDLPEEVSQLHYLQGLYATHNRLVRFPEPILLLPLLTKLDLSDNQIVGLPEEVSRMDQLTRLTMDRNLLTSIPVELYELSRLNVLELAGNGLTAIPEGISNLTSLEKLDLSGNQLTGLPGEMSTLSESLKELNLQGNRIPPEELQWLKEALPETQIRY
jgi:Leucine-rich repeat (LRR) protein